MKVRKNNNFLALMRIHPRFINPSRQTQWLRDVASSTYFAAAYGGGSATCFGASDSYGVRPVFGLVGCYETHQSGEGV